MLDLRERRVLVTGGAGFIGSHLVQFLVKQGMSVTVLDNFSTGNRRNLAHLPSSSFELHDLDVRDTKSVCRLLRGVDIVFHLACLGVRHSIHSPLENHDVNATATLGLIKACTDQDVSRFVQVSSSEVYGAARTVPMKESHPTTPHTVYGASKLAGEAYARAAFRTDGFATVVVRPFNTYGPRSHHEGDSGEVIPRMMILALAGRPLTVFGKGHQTRDFTYVEDTAQGILSAALSDDLIGETVNLGSGKEISISDLALVIKDVCGSNSPIEYRDPRPGDVGRLYADATMAKEMVGFEPAVNLEEGLQRLRTWYLNSDVPLDDWARQIQPVNWQ